jgi:hypothetical protein
VIHYPARYVLALVDSQVERFPEIAEQETMCNIVPVYPDKPAPTVYSFIYSFSRRRLLDTAVLRRVHNIMLFVTKFSAVLSLGSSR